MDGSGLYGAFDTTGVASPYNPPVTELQRIVDTLARSAHCAVSIHDRNRRLLAYSAHQGMVDEVRKESILTRRGPQRGYSWARQFGIEEAMAPVRIPANLDLGMTARVCAPIRSESRLIGFLWLADPDESLPDDVLDLAQSAADAAALAIQQAELMDQLDRGRGRELLRDLLSDEAGVRQHAVSELIESRLLVPGDLAVVFVARPLRERLPLAPSDTAARTRVERAVARSIADLPPRQALQLVRPDHGVLLVTLAKHQVATIPELGANLQAHLADAFKADRGSKTAKAWSVVVGIGDAETELEASYRSYIQARKAAEVCGVLTYAGPVARWSDLGVYQTLLQLPVSQVDMSALHPGLVRLFAARDAGLWVHTLECYLDRGCDAPAAAKALAINKSSLYHRIHRIEQIGEVDLRSGDDRLAFHLGLKLARLAGLIDSVSA